MQNYRPALAYLFLFLLAILIIVIGFQGSLGKMLAVVLAPGRLQVISPDQALANKVAGIVGAS